MGEVNYSLFKRDVSTSEMLAMEKFFFFLNFKFSNLSYFIDVKF